ncbi:major facilitator superfamily domain-containing protein [Plectosphaerella cucumerina]|uniref:Major facilitator superfamily domain-containing protein n=1 Tax=Plectosphaerella cucumerina TaxID=40658 RepID=A0A8K0TNL1_9PEZI|nr:major facilitator superfamily domain-containing protein [Plectosphaerella cucumerina]
MATQTETIVLEPLPAKSGQTSEYEVPLGSSTQAPEFQLLTHGEEYVAQTPSLLRKITVPLILAGINFASSCSNGLVVIGLPRITQNLNLPASLAFWPASVNSLATASTILLAGSVADVIGPRSVDLVGNILSGAMMLGAGFVQTGEQLVVMRALQGVGLALHFSSSVALVTKIMPRGRGRNLAFACLGLSQPLGFCFGLVIGGVLTDSIGWRAGWYLYGSITLLLTAIGFWSLPKSAPLGSLQSVLHSLKTQVDWVGAFLGSAFLALVCYFLASISADVEKAKEPGSIVVLCLGVITLPLFIAWGHRQVKTGKPAMIPNSFWRIGAFSSICITVASSFGVVNSLELFASLFFQEIQGLTALQAAIRIIPSLVVGVLTNAVIGMFVHKIPAVWIIVVTAVVSSVAPLLMAVIQPEWPYWTNAFIAQLLMPINANALFTVGMIVITDIFPEDKQSLAGAVFNTAGQFGTAFGYSIMQVISALVSQGQDGMKPSQALMEGYRAAFWAMLAMTLSAAIIAAFGLRKTGKIGGKQD